MNNYKVLHVIARMNVGGTSKYVGEIIKGLNNCYLATGFTQGEEKEDPILKEIDYVRVKSLGRKISLINDVKAYFELKKIVNDIKPLVIHSHTFKAGLIARLIPGNHKRIHTFHGHLFDASTFSSVQKLIIRFIEKFLANRTDYLVSVGNKVSQELRNFGIGKKSKWVSIPPGVDFSLSASRIKARKSLELTKEAVIIGWLARVTEVKNPLLFLKIASLLPNFQFVIGGHGNLFDEVKKAAPNNVKVIGWADPRIFWAAVDIAVSTSSNEGMPIALIEAELAGLPIVATDVGSTSEVIKSGISGVLVNANCSAIEFADEINKLAIDSEFRKSMGNSGKEFAKYEFSLGKMIARHKIIYSEFI